ncbi:MAG: TOMM precursor leader peptide-binding protein [Nitrospira sp. CR1.3]|nr:TOMM precursor leader peptide-binding protein [Nitrospira sp. CR1.3]
MHPLANGTRLKALPIQLLHVKNGIVLKRGCCEFMVSGNGSAEAVHRILLATSNDNLNSTEICAIFAAPDRPAIERLIGQLADRRFLVPSDLQDPLMDDGIERSLEVFYWHFGAQEIVAEERLNKSSLAILGVNTISRQLAMTLASSNVVNFDVIDYPLLRNLRLFDSNTDSQLRDWPTHLKAPMGFARWLEETRVRQLGCLIVTSDFGWSPSVREWNKFCVDQKIVFFSAILQNFIGQVGPIVIPGESACLECVRARQNSNMDDVEIMCTPEDAAFEGQRVTGFHPSMSSIVGDIAAFELTRFFSGVIPMRKIGTLIEVNLLTMKMIPRKILKVPRCPVCSPLNTRSSTTHKKTQFAGATRVDP